MDELDLVTLVKWKIEKMEREMEGLMLAQKALERGERKKEKERTVCPNTQ